uniref:lytic transglycosylase domain-containing protein n=1 Tax=uncultured Rhizobium sp. TaxID=155567 RepID=UPI002611C693|nr:lytic transglycosylase domain-containing protein [uncultured Rhizobium sp.]
MIRRHLKAILLASLATLTLAISTSDSVATTGVCEREISAAALKYRIPEGILYSVGLTETGRRGSLQPWSLNVEGKAHFEKSAEDAIRTFEAAQNQGAVLIDLGCMQINHHFHSENFGSVAEMLNPRKNVEYAAKFLAQLHAKHVTWTMAVARYHAGPNNNPAQKMYVCRVISNLVATGYGNWTPQAQKFCSN